MSKEAMGKQRNRNQVLISRLGGMCLLLLGVHSTGDFFNRSAFRFIDSLDLAFDQLGWAFLQKLSSLSALSHSTADKASESLARWVDLYEKEVLAGAIGLLIELSCVGLLADFAWGHRPPAPEPATPAPTFKNKRYRNIFNKVEPPPEPPPEPSHFRFEPLAISTTIALFTMSGLCFLALTVENLLFKIFEPYPSIIRYMVPAGASLGVLLGVVSLIRFLPPMLLGAYRKSLERILPELRLQLISATAPRPRGLQNLPRYIICDSRRGAVVVFTLLPLGILSLVTSIQLNASAIWMSLGAIP